MDPDRFRRLGELFHAAVDLAPAERADFLARECGRDASLRAEVERLLHNDDRARDLVERFSVFPESDSDPLLGRTLGAWRIDSRIAAGGMGVVYRARRADGLFEQQAAVKLLRVETASPELRRRFDEERRLLARLEHPHIARLLDGGTTDGGAPYLVMELVDGEPIDRACRERRWSLDQRLRTFVAVCHAVHFAHTNLVVHRDLKPGNVFVDRSGAPKLLDFGIARLLGDGEPATRTDARILTPEYASPEQLRGDPLTTASDVFSLGVVLHELLTGRRPGNGEGGEAGARMAEDARPHARPSTAALGAGDGDQRAASFAATLGVTPGRLRRMLAGDLDRIVLMALRLEPERRYASAEQLAEDVERFLGGMPVLARVDTLGYRTRRFVQRNRVAVGAATVAALALVAGLVSSLREQRLARIAAVRAAAAAEHARGEAASFRQIAEFLSAAFLDAGVESGERERVADNALRHAERARRQHGNDAHLLANLLDELGRLCLRVEQFEAAEQLLREGLALRLVTFGERSIEHALSLTSLGRLHYQRGEFAAARDVFERALALHSELPQQVHSDEATAANDLATAHRQSGDFAAARRLHERALELRRGSSEPDELSIAESLHNLAVVELDAGDAEVAARHVGQALTIRREMLGDEHALTLQSLGVQAGVAMRRGDVASAVTALELAEAGYRALGVRGLEGLTNTLSNRAAVALQQGELDLAARCTNEALELVRRRLPAEHPQVATVLGRLANVEQRRGNVDAAANCWREVVRIRRLHGGPADTSLRRALLAQGTFLLNVGRVAEAEAALRETLDGDPDASPDPTFLAQRDLALGVCLLRANRTDDARAFLERAASGFDRLEGNDSQNGKRARQYLERAKPR